MENDLSQEELCEHTQIIKNQAQMVADSIYQRIKAHNMLVTREAYQAVRRPGPDFSVLFDVLNQLVGDLNMKKEIIKPITIQALKFNRSLLAHALNEYVRGLETEENNYRRIGKCMRCVQLTIPQLPLCACVGRKAG